MEETEVEVSNIDSMVISLLNQDRDSFSSAFSDAMKERISGKLSSMNQEVSKELLSNVDEGWADKALSLTTKTGRLAGRGAAKVGGVAAGAGRLAGRGAAKAGARFAANNPDTMNLARRVGSGIGARKDAITSRVGSGLRSAGSYAKQIASDPNVRDAAKRSTTLSTALRGGLSGNVGRTSTNAPTASADNKASADACQDAAGGQNTGGDSLTTALGKAAVGAWKKKREFQKAKQTGAKPPLKLASSHQPEGDELIEMNYTFDSPRTAKKFMTSATQAGLNKKDLTSKGKTVTVGNIKDKDMKEMIRYLAKEMKASIKESLIPALQLAVYTDETVIVEAKNGIDIHITPKDASIISHVHDSLNEDNQTTMRDMMLESEEEYTKILNFCKEQSIEEESNHVN